MSDNYTNEMEATLRAAEPVSYEDARKFAAEFGKPHRSVISKVKHMGLEYLPKPAPVKRPKGLTKADLVANVAEALSVKVEALEGLDKATGNALRALVDAIS